MRKYLQITFFLGIFGVLVLVRQIRGTESTRVVGGNQTPVLPTTSTTQPTSTPAQSSNSNSSSIPTSTPAQSAGLYKNGTYTGSTQDAFYGLLQVQATISNGKISDVVFLQYPNDNPTSISVNSQAMPLLKQEALQAQSANVDIISGASASSQAFQLSLADALAKAK